MPKFFYKIAYLNAIIYTAESSGNTGGHFQKYHSIKNTPVHISKFCAFAKGKFPSAKHVNFYNKETKRFVERIYLE